MSYQVYDLQIFCPILQVVVHFLDGVFCKHKSLWFWWSPFYLFFLLLLVMFQRWNSPFFLILLISKSLSPFFFLYTMSVMSCLMFSSILPISCATGTVAFNQLISPSVKINSLSYFLLWQESKFPSSGIVQVSAAWKLHLWETMSPCQWQEEGYVSCLVKLSSSFNPNKAERVCRLEGWRTANFWWESLHTFVFSSSRLANQRSK